MMHSLTDLLILWKDQDEQVLWSHLPVAQQLGKHCHLQEHFTTAAYEIPNFSYFSYSLPVPVFHASLKGYVHF